MYGGHTLKESLVEGGHKCIIMKGPLFSLAQTAVSLERWRRKLGTLHIWSLIAAGFTRNNSRPFRENKIPAATLCHPMQCVTSPAVLSSMVRKVGVCRHGFPPSKVRWSNEVLEEKTETERITLHEDCTSHLLRLCGTVESFSKRLCPQLTILMAVCIYFACVVTRDDQLCLSAYAQAFGMSGVCSL